MNEYMRLIGCHRPCQAIDIGHCLHYALEIFKRPLKIDDEYYTQAEATHLHQATAGWSPSHNPLNQERPILVICRCCQFTRIPVSQRRWIGVHLHDEGRCWNSRRATLPWVCSCCTSTEPISLPCTELMCAGALHSELRCSSLHHSRSEHNKWSNSLVQDYGNASAYI